MPDQKQDGRDLDDSSEAPAQGDAVPDWTDESGEDVFDSFDPNVTRH